jgi:heme/copper-type cytochrome/quinol oxidase subunit 4
VKAGNGYFSMWIALMGAAKIFSLAFFTGAGNTAEEVAEAAKKATVNKGSSYIVALLLFSLAVLIAAAIECDEKDECKDYRAWAVACPVLSIAVCLFLLIVMALETFTEEVMHLVKMICTSFLLNIWIAGTYCMTFRRPFTDPAVNANGWFGAWLALITVWTAFSELDFMPNLDKFGGWAFRMMAAGSLILGLQAAHDCDAMDCGENYLGWAVSCGWVGFVVYIVFIILARCDCLSDLVAKVFAIFFAGWYTCGMAILTYERPYTKLSNAYFGLWIAVICSYLILVQTLLA